MSGIYIPGMKMPPNGKYLQLRIDSDGKINGEYNEDKYICTNFVEREEKAIELPPHGRLIDADDIETISIDWELGDIAKVNAPTIIPADQKEVAK